MHLLAVNVASVHARSASMILKAANTLTTNHTNTDIRLITDTDTNYTATTLTATTQTYCY